MRSLPVVRKFTHRGSIESGLRLDMGERAVDFPDEDFEKFVNSLSQKDFICYPSEKDYEYFKKKISRLEDLPFSFINLNFGSDQVIRNVFDLCSKKGGEVIINDPCFPMYKVYADTFNLKCQTIEYDGDLNFQITDILNKLNDNTVLVALANPNSPFGDIKSCDEIVFLCQELERREVMLLLDEAYIDFGGKSSTFLTKLYSNLIICKTFSKAWGGAGARCGYSISHPVNITQLEKVRPSFPATGATLKYLNFLVDNIHLKDEYVQSIQDERDKILKNANTRFSIQYGCVNWIHINDIDDNIFLDKLLKSHNISYKNKLTVPHDKRKNWIRIGIKSGISDFFQ